VKVATSVLAIALAALIAGAVAARGRSSEELPVHPRKVPAVQAPALVEEGSLADPSVSASRAGTLSFRLIESGREQREIRARMQAGPLREAEARRLRELDTAVTAGGQALPAILRGNPEAWRDVIALLSCTDEFDGARDIVGRIRGAIDLSVEGLWTDLLRTSSRAEDRRLALFALAGRASSDVIVALVHAAQEDSDSRVRGEALSALANVRRQPMSEELARMVNETLKQRTSADQDAAVRQLAAGIVTQINRESAPPPPPSRRLLFVRSPKTRPVFARQNP
jgi:HEAT repeat protein